MSLRSLVFGSRDSDALGDVSDDVLTEAAFELRELGSHIGWIDQDREAEYRAIAEHLEAVSEDGERTGKFRNRWKPLRRTESDE